MPSLMSIDQALTEKEEGLVNEFIPEEPPIEGMTQKQVSFVDYLIIFRGNRSRAYCEAGYTVANMNVAGVEGHKMLKNRKIQRLLAWRLDQLRASQQIEVRQQRVIRELNRLAFSSVADICSWDEDGTVTMKTMDDLTDDVVASIKKVKCVKTVRYGVDGESTETTTLEIEQHDKKGPLEILSRASKLIDKGSASVPAVTINMNFGTPEPEKKPAKVVNP
jgi:phage terminase small subunit